jgi:hypothetical protein
MEATINNIFADENFNDALNAMVTMAEYSKMNSYKADICSDIIMDILTYQSLYANKPISEIVFTGFRNKEVENHDSKKVKDIKRNIRFIRIRAHCTHIDENGNTDRTLSLVKINDRPWLRCDLCKALIYMNPPLNFAPVISCVKKTIAEYLEKDNDEKMTEVYGVLLKDAAIMYNIDVELKRMIKREKHRKPASERNSPLNLSNTINTILE